MARKNFTKKTVKELVTDRIIEQLDKQEIPWRRTWVSEVPTSLSSGKPYRGLNYFILSSFDFKSKFWGTFNQIQALGGRVKKGEKAAIVQFWKFGSYLEKDEDGNPIITESGELKEGKRVLLRYYRVFNLDQTTGVDLKGKKYQELVKLAEKNKINVDSEKILENYYNPPSYTESITENPRYSLSRDTVFMPPIENFESSDEYYATQFHELVHSTGHESRNNRSIMNGKNSDPYAVEELIAEIGAALLCGYTGIENKKVFENNVAYIQEWNKRFKNDRNVLLKAIQGANKGVDFILNEKKKRDTIDN